MQTLWAITAEHQRLRFLLVSLLVLGILAVVLRPQAAWAWLKYWASEVRRLWVPIVAMVLIHTYRHLLDPTSDAARVLYKINIVAGAVLLAHMLRSQLFPYIKLGDMLNGNGGRSVPPQVALGACVLIGLFMLAVILGFAMGL